MNWFYEAIFEHTALQAVIIISLIVAVGLGLGKIKFWGISLGVTFVFFTGILAGHLGLSIDMQMLTFAENFGLVLFIYALGVQVGPGFISSFHSGGIKLNALSMGVILIGTIMTVAMSKIFSIDIANMVGVLCGATTNTCSLAAAQQALKQIGEPSTGVALSCAVTYPLGVVGVILAIIVVRKFFATPQSFDDTHQEDINQTYVAAFQVRNPAVYGKDVQSVAKLCVAKFVISRVWRQGIVKIPTGNTVLKENDRLLVIAAEKDVEALTLLFGQQENRDWNKDDIDWNAIDSQLISKRIVISRPELNGKKLGSLRLRNHYGINISRVTRSGVQLLATPQLVLQFGDRLTVVGEAAAISNVEKVLGGEVSHLKDPNLAAIFIGLLVGLLVGSIPIAVPGISVPVKLGLAGGPIIVGIIIGAYGPRFHLVTYSTRSANLMIRGVGLSLYLACLGLDAGAHFFETVMRPEGLIWIALGFVLTLVPVLIMAYVALRICKIDFGHTCGMLCGSMANPMALNYANDIVPNDNPSVSYATVYPVGMFSRVIIAQILIMIFL